MSKLNVLFVDDEQALHILYKAAFKKPIQDGMFEAHHFINPQDCVTYLEKSAPSEKVMVFTDINMPHMDGFELIEKINSLNRKIDIYIVSAYDSADFIGRGQKLGAKGFLGKPVSYQRVLNIIQESLS